jgi:Xaa-Pro aminopeptidase
MLAERSHKERRRELMERCPGGLILVRGQGAAGLNPSFLYLTGIEEPRASLLLAPGGARIETGAAHPGPDYVRGRTVREILFLPATDPVAARWGEEGTATFERTQATAAGVDAIFEARRLEATLGALLQVAPVLDCVRGAPAGLVGDDGPDVEFVERVRRRLFGVAVRDATAIVHEMRRVKDTGEVRAIERALAVTAEALDRALRALRPGIAEAEIEAEITAVYRGRGARHAFEPIVAAGRNAAFPHYKSNAGPVQPGELLLLDTGACLGGYCGDITRTVPVSGRFSARQRTVYEAVLRAEREAIALCRPGALLADVHTRAFEVIAAAGFGPHFIHGTSHHLGLECHDPGDVHRPLAEGCVVTVEPGIYLPDESLGVRIEDDVLVTAAGPRVLSEAIPTSIEAIESGWR